MRLMKKHIFTVSWPIMLVIEISASQTWHQQKNKKKTGIVKNSQLMLQNKQELKCAMEVIKPFDFTSFW